MKISSKFFTLTLSTLLAISINVSNISNAAETAVVYKEINPIELVNSPQAFLSSKVKVNAVFDKFSSLGLDYKPAFKDSKNYISFLIRRSDVLEGQVIPLSELKLFIQREKAEKLTELEAGDKIEFTGTVFSSALNDPWVDVDNLKILSVKTKKVAKKSSSATRIK